MQTDGGGWTYVKRGTDSTGQSDSPHGTVQTDPSVATRWGLGMALTNQLKSADATYLEYYITGAPGGGGGYTRPTPYLDFRVLRTPQDFTFSAPFDNTHGVQAWTGSTWTNVVGCSSADRGPCWEPGSTNYCCRRDTSSYAWVNCGQASRNSEGQYSHTNTNQHLRCSEDDYTQDGPVLFVR